MKTSDLKEPIRIRFKQLKNGCRSIYLDCYLGNGRRAYRFLSLYLRPERTGEDRKWNKEQLRLACAIKSQQIVQMQNGIYGFKDKSCLMKSNFIDYCRDQCLRYRSRGQKTCAVLLEYAISRLVGYRGADVPFAHVDKEYLTGFIEYLHNDCYVWDRCRRENTKRSISDEYRSVLFARVLTVLNMAVKEGIIDRNPGRDIDRHLKPKGSVKSRCYLTVEELKQIIATPYKPQNDIKSAFLFCCFCGLRWSDVRDLTWNDIRYGSDSQAQIEITMKKTGLPIYLPLSENALSWLPPRTDATGGTPVFRHLPRQASNADCRLATLVKKAGISKHVTFHVARHTFATLTLTYGADLYTVSKLLGHTKVQTTQIYARIVDESKRKAVNLIPRL